MKRTGSEVNLGDQPATFYQLLRLASILAKKADAELGEKQGLSLSSAQALVYLSEHAGETQGAVAKALGVTPAVITRHIVTLSRMGLVKQVQNADNRRQNVVSLTDMGQEKASELSQYLGEFGAQATAALDGTAARILGEALGTMLAAMAE